MPQQRDTCLPGLRHVLHSTKWLGTCSYSFRPRNFNVNNLTNNVHSHLHYLHNWESLTNVMSVTKWNWYSRIPNLYWETLQEVIVIYNIIHCEVIEDNVLWELKRKSFNAAQSHRIYSSYRTLKPLLILWYKILIFTHDVTQYLTNPFMYNHATLPDAATLETTLWTT